MILYDFPRSSASYRVRIACALKGVEPDRVLINFRENEQRADAYLREAPLGLVPTIRFGSDFVLSQSLAIIRFLDRQFPEPRLIPQAPRDEARALEFALTIGCDIHPLNNLRVLSYMESELGVNEASRNRWYAHWIKLGLEALEKKLMPFNDRYCVGDHISIADVFLVPQLFNARRFKVDLGGVPRLVEIDGDLQALPPFSRSRP